MAGKNISQTVQGSGGGASGNLVGWRDANNAIGDLFSDSSKASASSGNITVGDVIMGGTKKSLEFGLVKILAILAGLAIVVKIWKGKK